LPGKTRILVSDARAAGALLPGVALLLQVCHLVEELLSGPAGVRAFHRVILCDGVTAQRL